jgi:hypothetical protein
MLHLQHSCHNHLAIDIASHRRELRKTMYDLLHPYYNHQATDIACHRHVVGIVAWVH